MCCRNIRKNRYIAWFFVLISLICFAFLLVDVAAFDLRTIERASRALYNWNNKATATTINRMWFLRFRLKWEMWFNDDMIHSRARTQTRTAQHAVSYTFTNSILDTSVDMRWNDTLLPFVFVLSMCVLRACVCRCVMRSCDFCNFVLGVMDLLLQHCTTAADANAMECSWKSS